MIRSIAYVDTFALVACLFRMKAVFDTEDQTADGEGNTRILNLVPLLKDKNWQAAKAVTARSLNAMAQHNNGVRPEIASLIIEKLMPQGLIPWSRKEGKKTLTFHAAIVSNPGSHLYCGGAAVNVLPGQVVGVDTSLPTSATNMGDTPRYHLIMEIKPLAETVKISEVKQ